MVKYFYFGEILSNYLIHTPHIIPLVWGCKAVVLALLLVQLLLVFRRYPVRHTDRKGITVNCYSSLPNVNVFQAQCREQRRPNQSIRHRRCKARQWINIHFRYLIDGSPRLLLRTFRSTTGEDHGLIDGSMMPVLYDFLVSSRSTYGNCLAIWRIGFASPVSILYFTNLVLLARQFSKATSSPVSVVMFLINEMQKLSLIHFCWKLHFLYSFQESTDVMD